MKKKNNLKNYLKIGILLFGVSLLLYNCEKENINETSEPQGIVKEIQQAFNKEDFTKSIPYEFDVNWDLVKKEYSEELKTDYYEFPISYGSTLTPHINDLKKIKGNYFKSYKVIATIKNENINFYALRVYEKISETGQIISAVNFNYSSNFNGLIHLVDNENAIVFAKKIEKGIESIKDYYAKDLKELDPIKSREVYTCATVVTDHYKDWYKKWTDEDGSHTEYRYTQYLGRSSEIICAYEYLPDYDTSSSGAGGGSPGAGPGTYKKDCNSTPNNKGKYFSRESDGCAVIVTEDTDECPEGKVYNSDLDECECPDGKTEDSNGLCIDKKPCIGDPVLNPKVAAQKYSGIKGGMFGLTRSGGTQPHYGLDLENPYGKPIYALHNGTGRLVTQTKRGKVVGAGHYIEITSSINGKIVKIMYFHMQNNNRKSGTISAGDIIGYQGDSGNLKNAIKQKLSVSHLHLKVKENGITVDPITYLKTTIDPNTGQVSNPCN